MTRFGRLGMVVTALGAAALLVACGSNDSPSATTTASPPAGQTQALSPSTQTGPSTSVETEGRLMVADAMAETVYVYDLESMEQVAEFPGLKLSTHLGAMALPDGRVVFVDEKQQEVVVIQTLGEPEIVARASAPSPAVWGAVDEDLQYFAYANGADEAFVGTAVLLDLATYEVHELEVKLGEDGELHVALGGSPLTLYVGIPGELHAYPVEDVIAGKQESASFTEINPGSHGMVITHGDRPRMFMSDLASMDVVGYDGVTLEASHGLAWDADGLAGGRNGRPRLSYDGGYIYGALAATVEPEHWEERENDIHIVDLSDESVHRVSLAPGVVGRFQISEPYALFYNIHPDGDFAYLFDVDPASNRFQEIVAQIPLESLEGGPEPGVATTGTEARSGAITPDGELAFVSQGGEGEIVVIDTAAQTIVSTIEVPTDLIGGGYLLAVQEGAEIVDTQVR